MAGKLWLVATPIGNLGDISARALEVLRAADLIAAEDTRNTVRLLNHFEIKKPLTSYHEYNKTEKAYELVREAQAGKNIAVVTDASSVVNVALRSPSFRKPSSKTPNFRFTSGSVLSS